MPAMPSPFACHFTIFRNYIFDAPRRINFETDETYVEGNQSAGGWGGLEIIGQDEPGRLIAGKLLSSGFIHRSFVGIVQPNRIGASWTAIFNALNFWLKLRKLAIVETMLAVPILKIVVLLLFLEDNDGTLRRKAKRLIPTRVKRLAWSVLFWLNDRYSTFLRKQYVIENAR